MRENELITDTPAQDHVAAGSADGCRGGARHRSRVLPPALLLALVLCGGCAAADGHHAAASAPRTTAVAARVAGRAHSASPSAACVHTVVSTLALIARRTYEEAASGRIVGQALKRVSRSTTLSSAVARGDARAARAAVSGLLAHQISFMEVTRGRRVLVTVGHGHGIAPAARPLLDASGRTVGRYVLSILGADGYVLNTVGLTGAQVLVRQGTRQLDGSLNPGPAQIPVSGSLGYQGITYRAVSFAGQAFPSGALRISLLVPATAFVACASSGDQTVANVYGRLAKSVYSAERVGRTSRIALHLIGGSAGFARAVANGDTGGCAAGVQAFFASSRHIVRVRALRRGQLVCDVGGPFALAPLHGQLRVGGRVIGSFVTSVQDDQGFVLLVHRFTGAEVVLRDAGQEIPSSTIVPAPALPARGHVTVGGRSFQVVFFTVERFPSGLLRVWLLVPRSGR